MALQPSGHLSGTTQGPSGIPTDPTGTLSLRENGMKSNTGRPPRRGPRGGAIVVRYYRRGGRMIEITADEARLIKNAKARESWAGRRQRGRPY